MIMFFKIVIAKDILDICKDYFFCENIIRNKCIA